MELHKDIGKLIKNHFPNYEMSPECSNEQKKHKIPLYCSDENRKDTHYSDVDILIPKGDKIKVIIEIEESDITPIRIFGKFLAAESSSCYIYNSEKYKVEDNSVKFIQILYTPKLNGNSSKHEQTKNIETSIQNLMLKCNKTGKIKNYEIICVKNKESDSDTKNKIINSIREGLK